VCAKCHGLAGEGGIGRRLVGSPILADPQALENIVRNGRVTRRGQMPAVGSGWTSEQMDVLIAYLEENPPSGG
jgi:mono/diheme cytochrome c family protein